jgi:hypothetical protein
MAQESKNRSRQSKGGGKKGRIHKELSRNNMFSNKVPIIGRAPKEIRRRGRRGETLG